MNTDERRYMIHTLGASSVFACTSGTLCFCVAQSRGRKRSPRWCGGITMTES